MSDLQTFKALSVVSAISNSLNIEIASISSAVITFDLGFIDDVEYHIYDDKLMLAEGDEEGKPRITTQQRRLLYGIAYENGLTVEEFE
jgi:hypothetical protein